MRANTSSSLLVSLILHAFVGALLFITTIYVAKPDQAPPVIFELVAGPPTAPDELVAPALGNTLAKVKLDIPKVELPPTPPDEPVVETIQAPPPEVRETVPAKPTVPDKPAPSKPDTTIAKKMDQKAKVSYQDYLKKHPIPKPSTTSTTPRRAVNVPRIDAQGIASGVRGGSTTNTRGGGGGTALAREEHDQLDTYISLLIQELKKAHEPPPGVSDLLEARVTFDITASGTILNPRISKSSGDKAFDESVLDAFRRVRPIGPTPNRKSDTWTVTFKLKDD